MDMDILDRIGRVGLVPVVVIDNADDAVQVAKALMCSGVDVMEITMRTAAGILAIRNIRKTYPEMLLGAGTVLSVEKAKESVEASAQFIVSPGFNPEVVQWCIDNGVAITPGCVTPSEIERALAYGIKIVKFFPADIYGGVKGCNALYGPYKSAGVKFIPTGVVNNDNLADYSDKPFIHAVGGAWLCTNEDIANHNFSAITAVANKAVDILLGFELAHIGINRQSIEPSMSLVEELSKAFNFAVKTGNSSIFAGPSIEVNNAIGLGDNGYITIKTNSIKRAMHYLGKRGFEADMEAAKYEEDKLIAIYLKKQFGGFVIQLLQK